MFYRTFKICMSHCSKQVLTLPILISLCSLYTLFLAYMAEYTKKYPISQITQKIPLQRDILPERKNDFTLVLLVMRVTSIMSAQLYELLWGLRMTWVDRPWLIPSSLAAHKAKPTKDWRRKTWWSPTRERLSYWPHTSVMWNAVPHMGGAANVSEWQGHLLSCQTFVWTAKNISITHSFSMLFKGFV